MSAHLMIVAGYMDHLPLSHKLALMKLCDSADDQTRVAFPGIEAVRLWSGTKKSRALEVMKDLQEWGYVMQLTAGHRGKRATFKVFPNAGDEAFSLAAKQGKECPGAARFEGPPSIPSAEEVKARVEALDSKGSAQKGSAVLDPTERVQNPGPNTEGSNSPDPIERERVQPPDERVQNAGRLGPDPRTPSVPASVTTTSEPLSSSATADAAADVEKADEVPSEKNDREDVTRLCDHLKQRIVANGCKEPTITNRWRDAARLMLDRDGRTENQVHRMIEWATNDEFWRANILSMPTLREKYDQMKLRAEADYRKQQQEAASPRRGDIDWNLAMERAKQMDQSLGAGGATA